MYGVPDTHFSLEEYWAWLQINEIAGYGIRNFPTTARLGMGCGDYWQHSNRYHLAGAIAKVEHRLRTDQWLGFPIRREYEGPVQMPYTWPITLGKWVRGVGVQTESLVEQKTLTLSTGSTIHDPVTFTTTVTFTDTNELIVRYPTSYYTTGCESYMIRPSCVSISSGVATISIPRARLLKPEYYLDYADDPDRPDYTDDSYFLNVVDVYRNYLNETTGANIVWRRHEGQINCMTCVTSVSCDPSGACSDVRQLACPYVREQRMGVIQLEPATYSGGWSKASYAVGCRNPDQVEINFMRGYHERYETVDENLARAVIAMAHNNMPRRYCSCDVQSLWYEDDTRALEPAVRLKAGRSTWGNYEAQQILNEFDRDRNSYGGGLL
jgi:hypothetical protein